MDTFCFVDDSSIVNNMSKFTSEDKAKMRFLSADRFLSI
jgi:hypothetical protein